MAFVLLAWSSAATAQQTVQITATADDAYERSSSIFYLSNCGAGADPCPVRISTVPSGGRDGGLRFAGVNLPVAAFVTSATLEGYISGANDDLVATVYGEATANAEDFVTSADVNGRARTTASVPVNQIDWGTGWKSIDVTALVQEIVNRPGWASGNALALLIIGANSGAGNCDFDSVDTAPATAPKLTVNFSGTASAVLGSHPYGQLPDQIDSYNATSYHDLPLFRFELKNPTGAPITVNQIVLQLTGVSGIAAGHLTDLSVRAGLTTRTDVVTGGIPEITVPPAGTITFNTGGSWTIPANATVYYTLTGDDGACLLRHPDDRAGGGEHHPGVGDARRRGPVERDAHLPDDPPTVAYSPNDLSDTMADLTLDYSANDASSWSAGFPAVQGPASIHRRGTVLRQLLRGARAQDGEHERRGRGVR